MDDLTRVRLNVREVATFDRIFNCILPKKWPIKLLAGNTEQVESGICEMYIGKNLDVRNE